MKTIVRKYKTQASLKLACVFTFMSLILTACVYDEEPSGGSLAIGDRLPFFTIEMSDGSLVTTPSLQGKVSLIMFFNTGCPDCREELPEVQKVWEYFRENPDVVIVPIAREEEEKEIKSYWEESGLSMPFSPQPNRKVYSLFATTIIPRIYISDPSTLIVFSSDDTDMPSAEKLISEILKIAKNVK